MANATIPVIQINEGNVGIGTTNPSQSNLVISPSAQSADVDGITVVYNPDGATNRVRGQLKIDNFSGVLELTNSADTIATYITAGGDSYFNSGNVGIGTTSPGRGLTIDKSNANAALEIIKNNTTNQIVYLGTGSSGGTDDPLLQMFHNGTENIRLYTTGNSWINGGNVGIGTTSPQRPLHVNGTEGVARFTSTASGNNGFEVGIGTASQAFLWQSESQFMQFATSNTERMRITSAGNVSIGTTTEEGRLLVQDSGLGNTDGDFVTNLVLMGSRWDLLFKQIRTADDTDWKNTTVRIQARVDSTNMQSIDFATDNSYNRHIDINTGSNNFNTRFTAGGNVGIGETSPAYKLHVTSASTPVAIFTGANNAYVDFSDPSSSVRLQNSGHSYFGTQTNTNLNFKTNGSQKMTILAGGNVGIGTTSPAQKLQVSGNTYVTGYVQASSALIGLKNGYATLGSNSTTTGIALSRDFLPSSYPDLIINSSGNVGIGTDSPSGPFHVKVGTSTPLIVASSSYCNNVGIRTTTPTASLQVKGNVSYSYNNYTNVANTWINVINFSGYPAGLYQISIIKKTNASTYITAIVKWSATAGTVISTIASNQLGITFSGTQLQAISGVATGTLMSANLQCLVTNEDFCS